MITIKAVFVMFDHSIDINNDNFGDKCRINLFEKDKLQTFVTYSGNRLF